MVKAAFPDDISHVSLRVRDLLQFIVYWRKSEDFDRRLWIDYPFTRLPSYNYKQFISTMTVKEEIENYLKGLGPAQSCTEIAAALNKKGQMPNVTKLLKELEKEGKAKSFKRGSSVIYNSI